MIPKDRTLTLSAVTSILVTLLFGYFTWSISKWSEGIEANGKDISRDLVDHNNRLIRLEQTSIFMMQSNSDIKQSIANLEHKVDRILDRVTGEKKDRDSK